MDEPDTLEDWVAVKEHPFLDESPKVRLNFNIAWNEIEQKIAITCRERSRVVSDKVPQGWTGLFTFRDLQGIHDQLCLIHPSLSLYLPNLPLEPRGVWAYLSNPQLPDENICALLEQYFLIALEICGQTLLTSTLFEEHTYDEYFENISALKRRNFDEAVAQAEDELKNVLFLRESSINMLDMAEVYLQEDEALFHLNIALARSYNYQLQPFLDLRELAFSKLQEAKSCLNNADLGARIKKQYATVFTEWQEQYVQALDTIQEIYKNYYSRTSELMEAVRSRMIEDKNKFGNSAFEVSAYDRLCRIEEDLSLEKQQKLKATMKWFENQRDKVKQEIASLDEKDNVKLEIEKLEKKVFDWQNKLYNVELTLMDEEESLVKVYIQQVLKQIAESEDEITFHDAVEDVEDLSSEDDDTKQDHHKTHPKLKRFKQRLMLINRKRANIRNRQKSYLKSITDKKNQKKEELKNLERHRVVQAKREAQKEELSEKQEFINKERKKTLERLRQHKQKYPNRNPLHPSRYSSKSQKRRSSDKPDGTDRTDGTTSQTKNTPVPPETVPSSKPGAPVPPPLAPLGLMPPVVPPPPPPPPIAPPPPPAPPVPPANLPLKKTDDVKKTGRAAESKNTDQMINLSDIQSARTKLKKSTEPVHTGPSKGEDPMSNMMLLIRQGVKLRRVVTPAAADGDSPSMTLSTPSESHLQHLQQALGRIQKLTASFSDDEEDSSEFTDQDFED